MEKRKINFCEECRREIGKKRKPKGKVYTDEEHTELCKNNIVNHTVCLKCKNKQIKRNLKIVKDMMRKEKEVEKQKKKNNDIANETLGRYVRNYV